MKISPKLKSTRRNLDIEIIGSHSLKDEYAYSLPESEKIFVIQNSPQVTDKQLQVPSVEITASSRFQSQDFNMQDFNYNYKNKATGLGNQSLIQMVNQVERNNQQDMLTGYNISVLVPIIPTINNGEVYSIEKMRQRKLKNIQSKLSVKTSINFKKLNQPQNQSDLETFNFSQEKNTQKASKRESSFPSFPSLVKQESFAEMNTISISKKKFFKEMLNQNPDSKKSSQTIFMNNLDLTKSQSSIFNNPKLDLNQVIKKLKNQQSKYLITQSQNTSSQNNLNSLKSQSTFDIYQNHRLLKDNSQNQFIHEDMLNSHNFINRDQSKESIEEASNDESILSDKKGTFMHSRSMSIEQSIQDNFQKVNTSLVTNSSQKKMQSQKLFKKQIDKALQGLDRVQVGSISERGLIQDLTVQEFNSKIIGLQLIAIKETLVIPFQQMGYLGGQGFQHSSKQLQNFVEIIANEIDKYVIHTQQAVVKYFDQKNKKINTLDSQIEQLRDKIKILEESLLNEQNRGYNKNFNKIEKDIEDFMQDQSISSAKIDGIFHPKHSFFDYQNIHINDGKISMPLNVLFDTDSSTITQDNIPIDNQQKVKKTLVFQDLQELLQLSSYSGAKTHLKDLQKYLRFILSLNRNLNLQDDGFRPSNIIPKLLDENLVNDLQNEYSKDGKEKRLKFQAEAMKFMQQFLSKQAKQTDVKFTQTNSYDELLIEKLQVLCDEYRLQISDSSLEMQNLKITILSLQQANDTMRKEQQGSRDKMLEAIVAQKEIQETMDRLEQEKNEQIDNLEFDKGKLLEQRDKQIERNIVLLSLNANQKSELLLQIEIIKGFEIDKLELEEFKNDAIQKLETIEIEHKEELEKIIEQNQQVIEQVSVQFQSEIDQSKQQLIDTQDKILMFEQLNSNLQKNIDELYVTIEESKKSNQQKTIDETNNNQIDAVVVEMNLDIKSLQTLIEEKSQEKEKEKTNPKISEEIFSQFKNSGIRSLTRMTPLGQILKQNRVSVANTEKSHSTQHNKSQTETFENLQDNINQSPALEQLIQANLNTKIDRGNSPIELSLMEEMKDQFDFDASGLKSIKESQRENDDSFQQILPVSLDPFSGRKQNDYDKEYSTFDKDLNKIINRIPSYGKQQGINKQQMRSSSQSQLSLELLVGSTIKTKQNVIFTVTPIKKISKLSLKNYNKQSNEDLLHIVPEIQTKNISTQYEIQGNIQTEQQDQLLKKILTNQSNSKSKDTLFNSDDKLSEQQTYKNQAHVRFSQSDLLILDEYNKKPSPPRLPISQYMIISKQKLSANGLGIKGFGLNKTIEQKYERSYQKQQLVINPFQKQEQQTSPFESPNHENQQENHFIYIDDKPKNYQAVQTDISWDFFEKIKNVLNFSKIIQKQTDNFSQTISLQALMKKGLSIQEADFGMQVSQQVIIKEVVLREKELNSQARFSPEREIMKFHLEINQNKKVGTNRLLARDNSQLQSFRGFAESDIEHIDDKEDDIQHIITKYADYAQEFVDQNKNKKNTIKINMQNVDDLVSSRVNHRKGTIDLRKFTIDQIVTGSQELVQTHHKTSSLGQRQTDRTQINQIQSVPQSYSPRDRVFSMKDVSTYKMNTLLRKDSSSKEIVGIKYGRSTKKLTQLEIDKIKLAKLLE